MVELASVVGNLLKGKSILVTGATGFLGKTFVEKVLRVQPSVKRLYLLVRAPNPYVAAQRLHSEIFGTDLFKVQREKLGIDFGSFISEKVVAVAGDVSLEKLGVKDRNLYEEMLEEINIIVNGAATTKFDERYDSAMATNTLGSFNVLNLAKICHKIEVLLHVSTAYVCGEAKGRIKEEPLHMGQTLKGSSILDINSEKQLIEKKLSELQAENASEKAITSIMRKFGMIRANLHGWPNTYVFTKAMGEMIVTNMKDNLPLIISRPTMVISTLSEPIPGWIQDVRHMDFVIAEYCKGKLTSFVGRPTTVLDVIPVDMVINSMIIALMAHSKSSSKSLIYHIGSSLRNPFKVSDFIDPMYCYYTNNICPNKHTKATDVTKKLTLYSASSDEFDQIKGSTFGSIVKLYRPYTVFEGFFDDQNAEKLRMEAKKIAGIDEGFNFDPRCINWKDYMMNIHFPGLMKYMIQSKM